MELSNDDPQNACSTYCEAEIMIKKLKIPCSYEIAVPFAKIISIDHLFTEAFIRNQENKANSIISYVS